MGTAESEKAIAQQKIDEDGMSSDSDFDGCRGRFCSSSRRHILKDVLRGVLVLAVLGIIVTVIFLLCFFLIKENKDEQLIDELANEISEFHDKPLPEFSIRANDPPPENNVGPSRGDLGHENEKLLDSRVKDTFSGGPVQPPREEFQGIGDRQFEFEDLHSTGDGRTDVRVKPGHFDREHRIRPPVELTPEDEAFLSFSDFVPVGVQNKAPPPQSPEIQEDEKMRIPPKLQDKITKSQQDDLPEALPGLDFDFEFEKMPPPVILTSEKRCEELRLPLCSGSMPWVMTSFPNWVNNTNRGHLQESLQYFQSVIVGSQCSPRALEYTCAILEPPCGADEIPLPPCRQFCRDVSSSCREFLMEGHSHNGVFNCEIFPESDDPAVCVNVKRPQETLPVVSKTEIQVKPDETPLTNSPELDQDIYKLKMPGGRDTRPQIPELAPINNNENFASAGDGPTINEGPLEEVVIIEQPEQKTVATPDGIPADTNTAPGDYPETEEPLQEEEYVEYEEPLVCDHTLFLCDDGSDCFSYDRVCNGIQECLDNSDEFNCTEETEPKGEDHFTCEKTRISIPLNWVCDGANDCEDNTDERDCLHDDSEKDLSDLPEEGNLLASESNSRIRQFRVIPDESVDIPGFNTFLKDGEKDAEVGEPAYIPENESDQGEVQPKQRTSDTIRFEGPSEASDGEIINPFPQDEQDSSEIPQETGKVVFPEEDQRPRLRTRTRIPQPPRIRLSNRRRQRIPVEERQTENSPEEAIQEKQEEMQVRRIPGRRRENEMRERPTRIRNRLPYVQPPNREVDEGPDQTIRRQNTQSHSNRLPPQYNSGQPLGMPPPYESLKIGANSEQTRPASIIRRRPTADNFRNPLQTKRVIEIEQEDSEAAEQENVEEYLAAPVTIPEKVLPHLEEGPNQAPQEASFNIEDLPVEENVRIPYNMDNSQHYYTAEQNAPPFNYQLAGSQYEEYENPQYSRNMHSPQHQEERYYESPPRRYPQQPSQAYPEDSYDTYLTAASFPYGRVVPPPDHRQAAYYSS